MRLFIGVWLSPQLRQEVAGYLEQICAGNPDWKWTSPDNLHVTLKFLGEVQPGRVADLRSRLEQTARNQNPFRLAISGTGVFPNRNTPRIVWLGLAEGAAELTVLAEGVDNACAASGFPKEAKAFKPHLTIGRARNERPRLAIPEPPLFQNFTLVSGFSLIQSKLLPGGPVYTSIADFPFARR